MPLTLQGALDMAGILEAFARREGLYDLWENLNSSVRLLQELRDAEADCRQTHPNPCLSIEQEPL